MPTIVERGVPFRTPWFDVITKTVAGLPGSDGEACYFAIKPADYVTVLAMTDEERFVFVRQYRPVVEDYTLELPSGHVDEGQTPEQAARQELLEETGYVAREIEPLGVLVPDSGRLANRQWCFFASGLSRAPGATIDKDTVEPLLLGRAEVAEHVLAGRFNHALHLAVFTLAGLRSGCPWPGPPTTADAPTTPG